MPADPAGSLAFRPAVSRAVATGADEEGRVSQLHALVANCASSSSERPHHWRMRFEQRDDLALLRVTCDAKRSITIGIELFLGLGTVS